MMTTTNTGQLDFIGDIHGHADELEALLGRLGYKDMESHYGGHPNGNMVVFLGDYIDRGPKIRRVLEIVRAMTDAGEAFAILGNHEMNALRYHARGRDNRPLRSHSETHRLQHEKTLKQIADPDPEAWQEWLRWFAGLPVFLDFGKVRAVHAAWDDEAIRELPRAQRWEGDTLEYYSRKTSPGYELISRVLNGPEVVLPDSFAVVDAEGVPRPEMRVKWWNNLSGATYRQAVFPDTDRVPDEPMRSGAACAGYPADAPPVIFGHYALRTDLPELLAPNVACIDFGMGKGGFLCAYRWEGEDALSWDGFRHASHSRQFLRSGYRVYVDDNLHFMDERHRWIAGDYATYEEAAAHAAFLRVPAFKDPRAATFFNDVPWVDPFGGARMPEPKSGAAGKLVS